MRPARKPEKTTTAIVTDWFTARLYACGHEHVTRDKHAKPADACPDCGTEKAARYPDSRHRRVVQPSPTT